MKPLSGSQISTVRKFSNFYSLYHARSMWRMPHSINKIIITFGINKILKKRLVSDFYTLISRDQITMIHIYFQI